MNCISITGYCLGVKSPWAVEGVALDVAGKRVEIGVEWTAGQEVPCPQCGKLCALFDHAPERRWRHLDTMQFETVIRARVPRSRKLAAWLKRNRPDAILTDLAEMQQMLDSLRMRVPEDLGLAAESILDGNASAGIDQRPEEIGRVATLLLISLINDNERGMPESMQQVLVSGAWVDGPSLPQRAR